MSLAQHTFLCRVMPCNMLVNRVTAVITGACCCAERSLQGGTVGSQRVPCPGHVLTLCDNVMNAVTLFTNYGDSK